MGTTTTYRTIHPVLNVTRYHDRAVYHHVTRLHYVVDVTRIQPVIHVHDITRLHHFTIAQDAYAYEPQEAAPIPYVQQSPVSAFGLGYGNGCSCGGE